MTLLMAKYRESLTLGLISVVRAKEQDKSRVPILLSALPVKEQAWSQSTTERSSFNNSVRRAMARAKLYKNASLAMERESLTRLAKNRSKFQKV